MFCCCYVHFRLIIVLYTHAMTAHKSAHPNPTALRQRRYTQRLKDQAAEADILASQSEARAAAAEALLATVPDQVMRFCAAGQQESLLRLLELGSRADSTIGVKRVLEWLAK